MALAAAAAVGATWNVALLASVGIGVIAAFNLLLSAAAALL